MTATATSSKTTTRVTIEFFRGPIKGAKKWRGRNRRDAEWAVDIVKDGDVWVSIRCYKMVARGWCDMHLADGFLARSEQAVAEKRAELRSICQSDSVRFTTSAPRPYRPEDSVL